jgi:hypothetical protein
VFDQVHLDLQDNHDHDTSKKNKVFISNKHKVPAVSHIPQFGDAASPAGDVGVSVGDKRL